MLQLLLVLIVFCVSVFSFAEQGTFRVQPYSGAPFNEPVFKQKIWDFLCSNGSCPSSEMLAESTSVAAQMHAEYVDLLNNAGTVSLNYSHKKSFSLETYDFSFPSAMQREVGHPSNMVRAKYFLPVGSKSCSSKLPTVIILHHALDDDEGPVELATNLATFDKSVGVLLIYLPHYGLRRRNSRLLAEDVRKKNVNWDFLDLYNPHNLQRNMLQGVLDIRMARDLLLGFMRRRVDASRLSIVGLSLGGILAPLVSAFEPQAYSGGLLSLVGGGNLARIFKNHLEVYPEDEFNLRYKDVDVTSPEFLSSVAAIDPIVWAHRITDSRVYLISARDDELVDINHSVEPLISQLDHATNEISIERQDGEHNPIKSKSKFGLFFDVFLPIKSFVRNNAPVGSGLGCRR